VCHVYTDAAIRILARLDYPRVPRNGVALPNLFYLLVLVIIAEEFILDLTARILERVVASFVRIRPPVAFKRRLLPLGLHHGLLVREVGLDFSLSLVACLLN